MIPGRPFPQQQNPWELAPEVYVARGRNLGHEEGYQKGWNDGWNEAVNQANQVINNLQCEHGQALWDKNRAVLLWDIFQDTVEELVERNPKARDAIFKIFQKKYTEKTGDALARQTIKAAPHVDPELLLESPLASKFIREAVNG